MRYLFMRYPNGLDKAVTLSYDDGRKEDLKLIEIADRYGIKVTLNVNSSKIDSNDEWYLTTDELLEIIDKGHEIAVHGEHHIAPGNVTVTAGIAEFYEGRKGLEQKLGKIIRGMAYPDSGITRLTNGITVEKIGGYLKDLGIVYARSLGGDNNRFELPQNFYNWIPTVHNANSKMMEYLDEFISYDNDSYIARQTPKLFYLWGHAYEFEGENKWDLLEEFCKKAGNREDIWYATNIEIYDYIEAFNSLVFSVDRSLVYNPTLKTVWFEVDEKPYKIAPGETLKID